LKRMWMTPPWSQPAERTVHHRPMPKTGMAPLAPNRKRAGVEGERKDKSPPCCSASGFRRAVTTSVARKSNPQPPITICRKPRSSPRPRSAAVRPNMPGLRRPQMRHCSSFTPTREPHEGHRVEDGRSPMGCVILSEGAGSRATRRPSIEAHQFKP
jgi:hypothetical protein